MNQEPQARLINFGRPPKGERRVRFADTMGMELVSIFLFELINEYIHHQHNRTRKNQIKAISHNSHHGYHSSNYTTDNTILKSSSASTATSNHIHNNNNNNNNICYSNYNHYSHSHHDSSRAYTASRPSLSSSSSSSASSSSSPAAAAPAGPYSSAPVSAAAPALAPPSPQSSAISPSFTCEFTQPVSLLSFNERVKLNKVHLETCQINSTAGPVSVSCTIRVLNLSYDKSVIVRYTTDDWRTHADSLASYKSGASDGWSDRFGATFTVADQLRCPKPGQRIIFAIRCEFDGGSTHWDNNGGLNYAIRTSLSGR